MVAKVQLRRTLAVAGIVGLCLVAGTAGEVVEPRIGGHARHRGSLARRQRELHHGHGHHHHHHKHSHSSEATQPEPTTCGTVTTETCTVTETGAASTTSSAAPTTGTASDSSSLSTSEASNTATNSEPTSSGSTSVTSSASSTGSSSSTSTSGSGSSGTPTATPTSTGTTTSATSTSSTGSYNNPPGTACAPKYTGGEYTISGTGTLPKPTEFVKRKGQELQLAGESYRMVGPNIYWLGTDENITPKGFPSKQRVREAMAQAVAMGANSIRATTLGISLGSNITLSPELDQYNPAAWEIMDYALYAAREYGLRVLIPLTSQWDYYHGGKYTFLRWLNVTEADYGAEFYTNPAVMDAFKRYISTLLNHYNLFSQTTWAEDPTIVAWETGNELGGYIGAQGYPPLSWTDNIAGFIKSIDSKHLVMDGSDGFWNYTTKVAAPGLNSSFIDIMSDHPYPLNNPLVTRELELVEEADKAFVIGEYDWTENPENGGSTTLDQFLGLVENTTALNGDLAWSLFGHDDQCCRWTEHNDGYTLAYPNGLISERLNGNILKLVQHWHRMTGREVPNTLPAVDCPQPVF